MLRALALAVLFGGCLQPASHDCGNGIVCPSGFTCDAQGRCVDPDRVAACAGKTEGELCTISVADDGSCAGGQCVTRTCGNGIVQPGERCDDGNRVDGDGCRGDCASEETCGNGVIDVAQGEQCDCGADASILGPGCGAPNAADGFCRTDCILQCGDGEVRGNETCDGGPPENESCIDYGFDLGVLGCSPVCSAGLDACDRVGWRALSGFAALGLTGLWAAGPSEAFVVASLGRVFHYDGSAVSLMPTGFGTNMDLHAVWGAAPDDVFVVGHDSDLAKSVVSRFDGSTWSSMIVPNVGPIVAVTGTSSTNVWAVGSTQVIHFDGTAWTEEVLPSIGVTVNLVDVAIAGADVYAVGIDNATNTVAFRRSAGTWTKLTLPAQRSARSVWASSATDVWIGGYQSSLLHFDGVGWTAIDPSDPGVVFDIDGAAADAMYALQGPVAERWDGQSLLPVAVDAPNMSRVSIVDGSHVFGIDDQRLYVATGHDWSEAALATGALDFFGRATDDVYEVNPDDDYILHWTGATWEQLVVGDRGYSSAWASGSTVYLAGGSTIARYDGTWTFDTPPAVCFDVWGSALDDVIVVGKNGLIYQYTTSWAEVTSPTGQALIAVWGRDATDVFAVGNTGTILHRAGGPTGSWTAMTSGTVRHLFAIGGSATETYAVGEAGTLLKLVGGTWTAIDLGITADLRDVAVVAPDDVYVVGTDETILHFDGAQWTPIRSPRQGVGWYSVYATPRAVLLGSGEGHAAWLVRPDP